MTRFAALVLICASVALTGCLRSAPDATCKGPGFQGLIGQPVSDAGPVPAPKRVILPDGVVTMDYNPQRTNIHVDGAGVITKLTCG